MQGPLKKDITIIEVILHTKHGHRTSLYNYVREIKKNLGIDFLLK